MKIATDKKLQDDIINVMRDSGFDKSIAARVKLTITEIKPKNASERPVEIVYIILTEMLQPPQV